MSDHVSARIIEKEHLPLWIEHLQRDYAVTAPVTTRQVTSFRDVEKPSEIDWNYTSTMIPPSKSIYTPQQTLLRFVKGAKGYRIEKPVPPTQKRVLVGVHPCDLHGLLVLERTFLGETEDAHYAAFRANVLIVGLNCQNVGDNCFCASMGTGPFFGYWMDQGPPRGCDALLTDLGDRFLLDTFGEKGEMLAGKVKSSPPTPGAIGEKLKREVAAKEQFRKRLDTTNLPALLRRNAQHHVWRITGNGQCLSCTNCTMVCPTCFCYDIWDRAELDLSVIERIRRWDSCQDERFAEVHGGNFRSTCEARLRQFVCHKLSHWVEQFGCFGCVGCGRCITWCPTGIDLTEIAADIRAEEERK
ncbi:MAG: 4Fe-4S dicluster domain-containing protein [Acidobacteriota bacterium]